MTSRLLSSMFITGCLWAIANLSEHQPSPLQSGKTIYNDYPVLLSIPRVNPPDSLIWRSYHGRNVMASQSETTGVIRAVFANRGKTSFNVEC
jgi:hypothetical protein